jgi:MFS family permease
MTIAASSSRGLEVLDGRAPLGPVRAWSAVGILWLFYVIAFMDRGVIALMVKPMMHDLGISPVQMGVLQGFAFATTYSLFALPLGQAVDHLRRRRVLFGGVLFWSCGTVACGFAHTYGQMVIARALVGTGEAVLTPAAFSLIADMFPKQRLTTATAVFSSGATMGVGAALIVGGSLLHALEQHGGIGQATPWQSVFLIFGTFGIFASGLSFLVPDARQEKDLRTSAMGTASLGEFARFLSERLPVISCLFFSFPLMLAISNAYLAWVPHHFETSFQWDANKTGIVLGALNLTAPLLGVIAGGYAMDEALRSGVRAPHILVPVIGTAIGVPLLAAGLLNSSAVIAVVLLALGLVVFNVYASAQGALIQLLAPADLRGRFAALYMLVVSMLGLGLGAILPPLINRVASHRGVGWATAMSILGIGAVVVIALLSGRAKVDAALRSAGHSPA